MPANSAARRCCEFVTMSVTMTMNVSWNPEFFPDEIRSAPAE
jgi:hypothetical protein